MLDSVKISRRQSEIRQELAGLVGKETPTEDETRAMENLDAEYRKNETRYRAALVAEDDERRAAGKELESRGGNEWADLLGKFEVRQVALALDDGRELDGATREVVAELRSRGGYRGIPIPLEALETRTGETVSTGTPDPISTRPIVDRLFAPTVAALMGGQFINISQGETEWPVVSSNVTAGWAATETGNVASPTAFTTTDKALRPEQTYGVQMKITRKALKQSGAGLEQAVRRDMTSAIQDGLDSAVFNGSGASGEPLGIIHGASTYGITDTPINAAATVDVFRTAIVRFINNNAAAGPYDVRVMISPEVWDTMDSTYIGTTAISHYDRLRVMISNGTVVSTRALADAGSPGSHAALLTTSAGGVPPFFVGMWGAIDMIRDPFTDAQSGGLRLTGLITADVQVARPEQLEVLSGIA